MDKSAAPLLLPILRSRQQAEVLAFLLDDSGRETSLGELSERLGIAVASVHREVGRAEAAGLVKSRRVGRTRLIAVDRSSRYVPALRELLVMAFGAPGRLAAVLGDVAGVESAFIFGSWAARWEGQGGLRPVADIDVLVLGTADRGEVYRCVSRVEEELGWEVNVTFRESDWINSGSDSFHATVMSRPLVQILGDKLVTGR